MKHPRVAAAAVLAYAVFAVLQTLGHWFGTGGLGVLDFVLMPTLTVFFLLRVRQRTRLVTWTTVALVFCWLGDWADWWLLAKIGFFLVAQVAYAVAFWPYRRWSALPRHGALFAYGVVLLGLVVGLSSQAGALAAPVAVYGAMLSVMCLLATGVNRLVGIGALVFLVSDIVLACYLFISPDLIPHSLALNSITYLPAQLLIVWGVIRHVDRVTAEPTMRLAASRR